MDFLFEVGCLTTPLIQEIVWLADLKYNVLDCLKHPHYFIPKNSIPIENHTGHNLARHAQLKNPNWIGVPPDTPNELIKQLIKKVLDRSVELTRFLGQILYSLKSDRQCLLDQNEKYGWNYHWNYEQVNWKGCTFNEQNRLIELKCNWNEQVKELDLSQYAQLRKLNCSYTNIKELNVSPCTQLQRLNCSYTHIKEIDLSHCTQLQELWCYNTQIKEMDVSQCTQLQHLSCSDIQIKELDVSQCTQLHILNCSWNTHIKKLDLSQCTQLQQLWFNNTQIEELNLSQCTELQKLYCHQTQIQQLDLSQCTQLRILFCSKRIKLIGDLTNTHVTR
jgi:hypothetical protein